MAVGICKAHSWLLLSESFPQLHTAAPERYNKVTTIWLQTWSILPWPLFTNSYDRICSCSLCIYKLFDKNPHLHLWIPEQQVWREWLLRLVRILCLILGFLLFFCLILHHLQEISNLEHLRTCSNFLQGYTLHQLEFTYHGLWLSEFHSCKGSVYIAFIIRLPNTVLHFNKNLGMHV